MAFYASIVLYNLKDQSWVFCWGTSKAVWEKVGGREGKLGLRDSPLRKGGLSNYVFLNFSNFPKEKCIENH